VLKEDADLRYFSVDHVGNVEDLTVNHEIYVLEITAPQTVISPTNRVYESEKLTVSLSCTDDFSGCDATYYTLDNSTPTVSSRRYTGPFSIRGTAVIKYFSVDQAGNHEVVRRASFVSTFGGAGAWDVWMLLLVLLLIYCRECRLTGGVGLSGRGFYHG
jgi:hypothetical protein